MIASALVIIAPGFEEIEAVCPIDLLRRAEVKVTTASVSSDLCVTGRSELTIKCDRLLGEVINDDFDLLVLPGGPAVFDLRNDTTITDLIVRFSNKNKTIGAICAAPLLLRDACLLTNRKYTAHISTLEELPDLKTQNETVTDGFLITSPGAGTAVEFALALINRLCGIEKAEEIRHSIHADFGK